MAERILLTDELTMKRFEDEITKYILVTDEQFEFVVETDVEVTAFRHYDDPDSVPDDEFYDNVLSGELDDYYNDFVIIDGQMVPRDGSFVFIISDPFDDEVKEYLDTGFPSYVDPEKKRKSKKNKR